MTKKDTLTIVRELEEQLIAAQGAVKTLTERLGHLATAAAWVLAPHTVCYAACVCGMPSGTVRCNPGCRPPSLTRTHSSKMTVWRLYPDLR